MSSLPDFKLETYFSKWEFNVKFNMCEIGRAHV